MQDMQNVLLCKLAFESACCVFNLWLANARYDECLM